MSELRPWHIGVLVLGVVVLSVSVYRELNDDSKVLLIADSVTVVDVVTGELFDSPLPSGKAVLYPAKNPGTGQMSVFPVDGKDGKWTIPDRYLPQVKDFVGARKDTAVEDLNQGVVRTNGDKPKRAQVF